jgi:hypothetical protein
MRGESGNGREGRLQSAPDEQKTHRQDAGAAHKSLPKSEISFSARDNGAQAYKLTAES